HDDIMIICLYQAQKKRLQRRLGPDYEIMTVDSSQGKEKSIVIVLTTRTEKVSDFFCNKNRCTVAVSRHQRALLILGNNSLLSHQLPWSKVLEDFTKIEPAQLPGPKWNPVPARASKKPTVQSKQTSVSIPLKKAAVQTKQKMVPGATLKKSLPQPKKKAVKRPSGSLKPKAASVSIAKNPDAKPKPVPMKPAVRPKKEPVPVSQKPVIHTKQKSVPLQVLQKPAVPHKPKPVQVAVSHKPTGEFKPEKVWTPDSANKVPSKAMKSGVDLELKKKKKKTTKERKDQRKRAQARKTAALLGSGSSH
ncbi:hypothetical protein PENTCL1PPCAC_6152, partial [Pristionchus entomophagus]